MDQQRRRLLIGASALPFSLGLSACGGGGGGENGPNASASDGLATAASLKPASGPYIDISTVGFGLNNNDWQNGLFPVPNPFRYMVPIANRTYGVKNNGVYYVEINDIVVYNGTTYSRSLWLRLATATSGNSYIMNTTGNTGLLTSNVLNSPISHKEYAIGSGTAKLTLSSGNAYTLELVDLIGGAATNEVLSGTPVAATNNQATANNLWIQTLGGVLPITVVQQDIDWV